MILILYILDFENRKYTKFQFNWSISIRDNNLISLPEFDFPLMAGFFNLLSSRANLHLSYNPAGRSHCRLKNHHGYIKHHHRGMGGSPGDVGEVPIPELKCLIIQPLHRFTYVTAHSPTLTPLHLRHRSF